MLFLFCIYARLSTSDILIFSCDWSRIVMTDNKSEKLFHALDEGADDVVHWAESEHEGYLYERTLDVCQDGVDVAIDFVR